MSKEVESTVPILPGSQLKILTPRMIDVLQAAADGEGLDSTAAVLGIARGTVHKYRGKLMKKLGADNMAHAVALGLRRGYIT